MGESVFAIYMSRFVPLVLAILRTRFVCHCLNPLQANIHSKQEMNNNKTIKAEQSKRRRGERERKETYLDTEMAEPILTQPGVSALFYTPCPGGYQRSRLSPMRTLIDRFLA